MTYRFNIANSVANKELCVSHCKARDYDGNIKEGLYVHISDDACRAFDHVIFNEKMPEDAEALIEIYARLPSLVLDREVLDTVDFEDDIEPIM